MLTDAMHQVSSDDDSLPRPIVLFLSVTPQVIACAESTDVHIPFGEATASTERLHWSFKGNARW
jgi:hypothetical protein